MAKDDIEISEIAGVPKRKGHPPAVLDTSVVELTAEEKLAIEAEVDAEISKELKADKRREYKASVKQKRKKQVLFQHGKDEAGEDTELVFVNLAPHMPFIRLDNNIYYPGRAYRLSKAKAAVVKEQIFRGELHDSEIHGKNMREFYGQRPRDTRLSPTSMSDIA